MTVHTGDFNAIVAQGYIPQEQASIREFISEFGQDYVSLSDLLDDWSEL